MDLACSYDEHLYLAKFSYSNNYEATIKMALFEALHGRRCQSFVFARIWKPTVFIVRVDIDDEHNGP